MTILPAKRQNSANNEESEENPQSNQSIGGLNIPASRLNHNHNHNSLGLNLSQAHGQLLKHQETNERQIWQRHDELQHSVVGLHQQLQHKNGFDETTSASCSSKRRTYAYATIPNAKERYYRNLERKRLRQAQKQQQQQDKDPGNQIPSELNLDDLLSNKSPSTGSVAVQLQQLQNSNSGAADLTQLQLQDDSVVGLSQRSSAEDATGYNSEDEYSEHPCKQLTEEEWRQRDLIFARSLEKRGFIIKPMVEDGACLFRAIADQVYGDQEMHSVVRAHCMDYILKNRDFYCAYVTEDFNKYVNRKRHDFVHGNHLEIQALSEMYHRSIEVYCYQLKPINIFHGAQKSDYEPIRLSYQRASHYNSITNPFNPSVGVGLGLPSYVLPAEIDRREVSDAVRQSEDLLLEQTMMEDKLKATDWEATNEVIEEQVARESYLQWCKDNEKRRKAQVQAHCSSMPGGSSSTITSASQSPGAGISPRSPRPRSGSMSPQTPGASTRSPKAPVPLPGAAPAMPMGPLGGPLGSVGISADQQCSMMDQFSAAGSSRSLNQNNNQMKLNNEGSGLVNAANGNTINVNNSNNANNNGSFSETDSIFSRLPPEVFGLRDWEDAGVMARVLAASQQEYLDSLKAARNRQTSLSPTLPPAASTSGSTTR